MKIAILGGIGPEATAYFYSELIKRVRVRGAVKRNIDYPQIFINSINAPELVTLETSIEDLEPYIRGVRELASLKPEFIVMACNTIHLFREKIIEESGFENISDMKSVVGSALETHPGSLSVIGTALTVSSGLYTIPGKVYKNPSTEQLRSIGNIVINFNATGDVLENKEALLEILKERKDAGVDTFIAGCTEVSELLQGNEEYIVLDTLELLIDNTVDKILNV